MNHRTTTNVIEGFKVLTKFKDGGVPGPGVSRSQCPVHDEEVQGFVGPSAIYIVDST
jgi:hypothetical protein